MKYFKWTDSVYKAFSKTFPGDHSDDALCLMHKFIKDEYQQAIKSKNEQSLEKLFFCLGDFYKHFCWKINWKKNSVSSMKKSCVNILAYIIQTGVILSKGRPSSKWVDSVLTAMNVFPGPFELLCDSLILVYNINKKFRPSFAAILKHFLFTNNLNVREAVSYFKIMLLLRRLKFMSENKLEKSKVVTSALSIRVPSDCRSWLLLHGIKHLMDVSVKSFAKTFLGKKLSPDFFKELRVAFELEIQSKENIHVVNDFEDLFAINAGTKNQGASPVKIIAGTSSSKDNPEVLGDTLSHTSVFEDRRFMNALYGNNIISGKNNHNNIKGLCSETKVEDNQISCGKETGDNFFAPSEIQNCIVIDSVTVNQDEFCGQVIDSCDGSATCINPSSEGLSSFVNKKGKKIKLTEPLREENCNKSPIAHSSEINFYVHSNEHRIIKADKLEEESFHSLLQSLEEKDNVVLFKPYDEVNGTSDNISIEEKLKTVSTNCQKSATPVKEMLFDFCNKQNLSERRCKEAIPMEDKSDCVLFNAGVNCGGNKQKNNFLEQVQLKPSLIPAKNSVSMLQNDNILGELSTQDQKEVKLTHLRQSIKVDNFSKNSESKSECLHESLLSEEKNSQFLGIKPLSLLSEMVREDEKSSPDNGHPLLADSNCASSTCLKVLQSSSPLNICFPCEDSEVRPIIEVNKGDSIKIDAVLNQNKSLNDKNKDLMIVYTHQKEKNYTEQFNKISKKSEIEKNLTHQSSVALELSKKDPANQTSITSSEKEPRDCPFQETVSKGNAIEKLEKKTSNYFDVSSLKESSNTSNVLYDSNQSQNKINDKRNKVESPVGIDNYIENVLHKLVNEVVSRVNSEGSCEMSMQLLTKEDTTSPASLNRSLAFSAIGSGFQTFSGISKQTVVDRKQCLSQAKTCIKRKLFDYRDAPTEHEVSVNDVSTLEFAELDGGNESLFGDNFSSDEIDNSESGSAENPFEKTLLPDLKSTNQKFISCSNMYDSRLSQIDIQSKCKSFTLEEATDFIANSPQLTVNVKKLCVEENTTDALFKNSSDELAKEPTKKSEIAKSLLKTKTKDISITMSNHGCILNKVLVSPTKEKINCDKIIISESDELFEIGTSESSSVPPPLVNFRNSENIGGKLEESKNEIENGIQKADGTDIGENRLKVFDQVNRLSPQSIFTKVNQIPIASNKNENNNSPQKLAFKDSSIINSLRSFKSSDDDILKDFLVSDSSVDEKNLSAEPFDLPLTSWNSPVKPLRKLRERKVSNANDCLSSVKVKKKKDRSDPILTSDLDRLTLNSPARASNSAMEEAQRPCDKLVRTTEDPTSERSQPASNTGYNLRSRKPLVLPGKLKYPK